MRLALGVLALVACKGKPADPPPAGSGSASATDAAVAIVADAAASIDAGPVLRDLFRTTAMTVQVSSRVVNASQKLEHLVDRDLNTAWNSRTNDLVGAWIEIALPRDVTVHELRMTAGHTGKGPKGEDYFTMNQRTSKVRVSHQSQPLGAFDLDIERRDLQTIVLPAPVTGGTLVITVEATVPGSKPTWKEVCVSELELWGTTPAGPAANVKPRVVEAPESVMAKLCPQPDKDPAYPYCSIEAAGAPLDAPWGGVALLNRVTSRSEHHGHLYNETIERSIALVSNNRVWTTGVLDTSDQSDPGTGSDKQDHSTFTLDDAETVNAIAGQPLELAISYSIAQAGGETERKLIVCTAEQRCTPPFDLDGNHAAPAAPPEPWSVTWTITPGFITFGKAIGEPPDEAKGKQPLKL